MYSTTDARIEINNLMDEALQERNADKAFQAADLLARNGEDDVADYWLKLANRWNKEDWLYDESINN